ncbi:MAG: cytochrome c [Ardenticatenaceae bacterium]|nr:cytochrome c [Ardenticatenaceae bacterium]
MYNVTLLLHSYTRWLVILAMVWALGWIWWGRATHREWGKWEDRAGFFFAMAFSLQFVLGVILYFLPAGLAQAAVRDFGEAMGVRELRFFGLEHPLQMIIALGLSHLGWARSRKAVMAKVKYRWAITCYLLATILVLSAIPWWRPLFRSIPAFASTPSSTVTTADEIDLTNGDWQEGQRIFYQSIENQPSCATCHSLDGRKIVGPPLDQIGGQAADRIPGVQAETYLYNSIVHPDDFIVSGYSDVMPAAYGEVLSEQELRHLIAFLLSQEE